MRETDETLRAYRARIHQTLLNLFKGLPLDRRLAQGGVMAIQAVCSASLAYGIGRALHTEQAFWAAMTAIAVTQHSYADTMSLSRDQLLGALVGGVLGLVGAILGGGHFYAYIITVAITIVSCWCLNVGSAARLGGVAATIVLLLPAQGPIWDIPFIRFGEVTLGAVCAVFVSWIVGVMERRWAPQS